MAQLYVLWQIIIHTRFDFMKVYSIFVIFTQ